MMSGHSSISSFNRKNNKTKSITFKNSIGGASAIVVILLIELIAWRCRHFYWDSNHILLEQKRKVLQSHKPSDDIAIFGTSRFYHLDPAIFKSLLPKEAKVTNYSWGWVSQEAYEGMLRALIMAKRKPRIILIDGTPEIFAYQSKYLTINEFPPFLIGYSETVPSLPAIITEIEQRKWNSAWEVLKYNLMPPTTKYRSFIRDKLRLWIKTGKKPTLPPDFEKLVMGWKNHGYFIYPPPDRIAVESEFVALEKALGPYVLRKNESIAILYERFFKLAKQHDIKVIMLPVPNNIVTWKALKDNNIYNHYDSWLDLMESKYNNFSAPKPRYLYWQNALGDAVHVNRAGAEKHLQLISEILKTNHLLN